MPTTKPVRALVFAPEDPDKAIIFEAGPFTPGGPYSKLEYDLEQYGRTVEELQMNPPPGPGLWVFEGEGWYDPGDGWEIDPDFGYEGTYRSLRPEEVEDLWASIGIEPGVRVEDASSCESPTPLSCDMGDVSEEIDSNMVRLLGRGP